MTKTIQKIVSLCVNTFWGYFVFGEGTKVTLQRTYHSAFIIHSGSFHFSFDKNKA